MLDEKDLQAIGQMLSAMDARMDSKLLAMEERMDSKLLAMEERMDSKLSAMEERMDSKLARQKQEILAETAHNMNVLIENVVTPKFNLLAEGQQIILEKLVPRSRVDELEDEVKFLKVIIRQINEDLQNFKKAN